MHEVAQAAASEARVVYVDIDPVAAYSRAILTGNQHADVVQADLRDVAAILDDPRARRLIDPTQPIGVLMVAILHFVPDDADPANIVAQYRKMMAPGSYLVVWHASYGGRSDLVEPATELYRRTTAPLTRRSRLEIEALLDGFDLVAPGGLFISREEEQPDNCFDNAVVLADRRAVATAFFAEHPPSLEMSDSVLHGGPHFADSGVELDLAGREIAAGESFERHGVDAVDADVTRPSAVERGVVT